MKSFESLWTVWEPFKRKKQEGSGRNSGEIKHGVFHMVVRISRVTFNDVLIISEHNPQRTPKVAISGCTYAVKSAAAVAALVASLFNVAPQTAPLWPKNVPIPTFNLSGCKKKKKKPMMCHLIFFLILPDRWLGAWERTQRREPAFRDPSGFGEQRLMWRPTENSLFQSQTPRGAGRGGWGWGRQGAVLHRISFQVAAWDWGGSWGKAGGRVQEKINYFSLTTPLKLYQWVCMF